jgi:glucose-6-phosphate isomerase
MDKNTPLSSLPSSEHEMESKGKDISKKKVEVDTTTVPSLQVIKNIQNYSKALNVKTTKSVLQFVEYITN